MEQHCKQLIPTERRGAHTIITAHHVRIIVAGKPLKSSVDTQVIAVKLFLFLLSLFRLVVYNSILCMCPTSSFFVLNIPVPTPFIVFNALVILG